MSQNLDLSTKSITYSNNYYNYSQEYSCDLNLYYYFVGMIFTDEITFVIKIVHLGTNQNIFDKSYRKSTLDTKAYSAFGIFT